MSLGAKFTGRSWARSLREAGVTGRAALADYAKSLIMESSQGGFR